MFLNISIKIKNFAYLFNLFRLLLVKKLNSKTFKYVQHAFYNC